LLKHYDLNEKECEEKYEKLDKGIKKIYKLEQVVSSISYQSAVFSLSFIKIPYMLAFDLAWIYFRGPLKLWNMLL
jgi:hypothetical protein